MKIAILGTGHIGKTLALTLSAAGHDVAVANSRGPETIDPSLLVNGARAETTAQAVQDVDAVILSIPLLRIPDVASLIAALPSETVIADTSNYYPVRDGQNAIGSDSFAKKAKPPGDPDRLVIPISADDERSRDVGMALVEDTGFDAVYAGTLADSWRQQPGAPAYCTDLKRDEMPAALAAAEVDRLPKRRDLSFAAVVERMTGTGARDPDADYIVCLNRALFM